MEHTYDQQQQNTDQQSMSPVSQVNDSFVTKRKMGITITMLVVVLVVGATWLFQSNNASDTQKAVSFNTAIIDITSTGFYPQQLDVSTGTVVTWINKSDAVSYIDSVPYLSHSVLPDLVSGSLSPGKSYSYTFYKTGNWNYTDDINPLLNGSVDVK